MGILNAKVDEYIAASENFAKPILETIREIVHQACPKVEEKIKWSFPHFDYNGKMLCHMAAFKNHCAFGFWLNNRLDDPDNILQKGNEKSAMGSLGKIQSIKNLPNKKILIKYIRQAMNLSDEGVKLNRKKVIKSELAIPDFFAKALTENQKAKSIFETFSKSHRNEYIHWVAEAKMESTRIKRLEKAIKQIEEGKKINWKYE